jgi:hypothetical protein
MMRGSVAMKVSDQEGYVCLGENEVKQGDKVALFRSDCTPVGTSNRAASPYGPACKKIKVGEGEITQLLNEHYSVVKTSPSVALQEGLIVEVLKAR